MPLRKGTKISKYVLDRRLGSGAFADVWRVRDKVENRWVALKIISDQVTKEFGKQEVEKEARITARLTHPHILGIRNADWVGNRLCLATDLARTNLSDYAPARRSGVMALKIIRQIVSALAYAHSNRVMHRDVKPENILIFPDGNAVLCDFGISCLVAPSTRTYTEVGTIGYMAPEQAYGRPSFASDVFSLGLVAHEILCGVLPKWPFAWPPEGYSKMRVKVPKPVRDVLRKAAKFEPGKRYKDGIELHKALERACRNLVHGNKIRAPRKRKNLKKSTSLEIQSRSFLRQSGRHLGMKYLCYRCSGPLAEEMHYCPWCGTGDNSFWAITPSAIVCPDCEKGVRPEWHACPWCARGRFQSNGRRPPKDQKAEKNCTRPGCEGQLRRFMKYCPLCKKKVLRPWIVKSLQDKCPRCRWPVSKEYWRYCPWCSRRDPHAGAFVKLSS